MVGNYSEIFSSEKFKTIQTILRNIQSHFISYVFKILFLWASNNTKIFANNLAVPKPFFWVFLQITSKYQWHNKIEHFSLLWTPHVPVMMWVCSAWGNGTDKAASVSSLEATVMRCRWMRMNTGEFSEWYSFTLISIYHTILQVPDTLCLDG